MFLVFATVTLLTSFIVAQGGYIRLLTLLILDANVVCGSSGSTTSVINVEDLDSINNCTVLRGSLYVQAHGDVDTLMLPPTLHTITGGLVCNGSGLEYDTNTIHAPALTTIASDKNDTSAITKLGLVITDYAFLTNLSFPSLSSIGSQFVLARNSLLNEIDGFTALAQVSGDLNITGSFYRLDLPSLVSVTGNVDIESSADNFTCPIPQLQIPVSLRGGSFVCAGSMKQVNNSQPTASRSITASSSWPSASGSSNPSSTAKSDSSFLNSSNLIHNEN
jgi:hypothetical protein